MNEPRVIETGPKQGPVVVFAHGAGAGPESDFMQRVSEFITQQGIGVARFEFPYWTQIRLTGKRRPPNPQPQLQQAMREIASAYANRPLWLMGKSMGARVAFTCADTLNAQGAIGLGFPFHPHKKTQDKPQSTRTHELSNQRRCNLVVQGTHDPMGKLDWVNQQQLPENLHIAWVETGNHDLIPHKSTGLDANESWRLIAAQVVHFIQDEEWRLSLLQ